MSPPPCEMQRSLPPKSLKWDNTNRQTPMQSSKRSPTIHTPPKPLASTGNNQLSLNSGAIPPQIHKWGYATVAQNPYLSSAIKSLKKTEEVILTKEVRTQKQLQMVSHTRKKYGVSESEVHSQIHELRQKHKNQKPQKWELRTEG